MGECITPPQHKCLKEVELNTITINMQTMQKDIEEIKTTLKAFIEKADDRYAGKWTEKVWIWILGVIGTALIGTLMTLLLK